MCKVLLKVTDITVSASETGAQELMLPGTMTVSEQRQELNVLFRWLAVGENSRLTPPKAILSALSQSGCFIEIKTRTAGHGSSRLSLSLW